MGKKRIDLQERILELNIDNIDWNKNVGKSKAIAIMDGELKIYLNGIKVEYDAETLQTLKEEYDIEPRFHSPDKLHFTTTFEVEDDYPVYKLLHSSDIGASRQGWEIFRIDTTQTA